MLNSQTKRIFIANLFAQFKTRFRFNLDHLILGVLVENSLLIRGQFHPDIAMLIYLIRHCTQFDLPHITNYNLTDNELLDLPVPFIYGVMDDMRVV
jgi:hypothetical protein